MVTEEDSAPLYKQETNNKDSALQDTYTVDNTVRHVSNGAKIGYAVW